jgi:hypothetical protein
MDRLQAPTGQTEFRNRDATVASFSAKLQSFGSSPARGWLDTNTTNKPSKPSRRPLSDACGHSTS